jgi:N6-adenosine-specific RNA methylase IME4
VSPLPSGPYSLCLMDPPWAFRTRSGEDRVPTCGPDPYPTMTIEAMAALPVGEMMARDAAIAMWVIGSHLDAALALAEGWGFGFTTDLFVWIKQRLVQADQIDLFTGDIPPPPIGMGYFTRKQSEACWLFTRGRGLPVLAHDVPQVIVAPKVEHSRKPAEQYLRLARLFGEVPRIEMFARNTAAGWDAWGNEVGKYAEASA